MRLAEYSQTKLALGGDITLAIVSKLTASEVDSIFNELWYQVFSFERRFSRFIPKSELSIFNRLAGLKTQVSDEFREILLVSKSLGEKSGGLYNPFITPALQKAGYKNSALKGYETDNQVDYTNRRVVGIDGLVIGDNWASIPFGTAIDLGGCGKGYLADELAGTLDLYDIQSYWLSLGGDIVTKGYDENGDGISVGVQDANKLGSRLDHVINCPSNYFAIATSGTFRRKGQNDMKSWHHIINPDTLLPADTDIKLVTVCTRSGVEADVLASCAIILGSKLAPVFLKKHGVNSAIIQYVAADGNLQIESFGEMIQKQIPTVNKEAIQYA